jgi:hypothetical protein
VRRRVSRADVAELRKASHVDDSCDKIAVIIREMVDWGGRIGPRTAEQEAMIAAAVAANRAGGPLQRIILDNRDRDEVSTAS